MPGGISRTAAHESVQILSPEEDKILARLITHLICNGFSASPALAMGLSEEIRRERVQFSKTATNTLEPVGKNWLTCFESRKADIAGIRMR
jgi:hypothetical protein